METCILLAEYIAKSAEQPLGNVADMWWRFEFQDTEGNLPHVHGILFLENADGDYLPQTLDRIRGSVAELIRPEELDELVQEGYLKSRMEGATLQAMAGRILSHICSHRCKRRYGTGENDVACRVTNNSEESPNPFDHTFATVAVPHSQQALEILRTLDLMEETPDGCLVPSAHPEVERLVAIKHYPPARKGEGKVSACNGRT